MSLPPGKARLRRPLVVAPKTASALDATGNTNRTHRAFAGFLTTIDSA